MLQDYIKEKTGGEGDCFANVLSVATGIPRGGIPNFSQHEDFWAAVDSYLYAWDLQIFPYEKDQHFGVQNVMGIGLNERGNQHVVLYTKDEVVYNSAPKGGDIEGDVDKFVVMPCYHSYSNEEISSGC